VKPARWVAVARDVVIRYFGEGFGELLSDIRLEAFLTRLL
jgi:hypothetical protein